MKTEKYNLPGFEFLGINGVTLSACTGNCGRLDHYQTKTTPINEKTKPETRYGVNKMKAKTNMQDYLVGKINEEITNLHVKAHEGELSIQERDEQLGEFWKIRNAFFPGGLEKMSENYQNTLVNKIEGGNK